MTLRTILPCTALFLSLVSLKIDATQASSPIIAAYYENHSQFYSGTRRSSFSLKTLDPDLLTDLYFAFAGFGYVPKSVDPKNPRLTGDFFIQPMQENDQSVLYPQLQDLKNRSRDGLRLFLSIGGWSFNDPEDPEGAGEKTYHLFSQMVSNVKNRKMFIDGAIEYAHRHGFDGIDIDWEYPGDQSRGGTPEDFTNFIEFLKECSAAFLHAQPPLLLSYAVPPFIPIGVSKNFQGRPEHYYRWVAECAKYLDRVQIMAYDYHGPFDIPQITGANAPLNRDTNPQSSYYIAKSLQNYLDNGVPASKILLGIPTFGHSYAEVSGLGFNDNGPGKSFKKPGAPGPSTKKAGLLAYFEILDMLSQRQLTLGTDAITDTAYGYHLPSQTWSSFDIPSTTILKTQKAVNLNLKGVVFWSVNMDEYEKEPKFPNIRSARDVLYMDMQSAEH
jgi:chitinase